uniref:Uncharacterized protein n=1 Tax=Oryza nivara TaxID=4536 RepID=A0A0E0HLT9_ORYNI
MQPLLEAICSVFTIANTLHVEGNMASFSHRNLDAKRHIRVMLSRILQSLVVSMLKLKNTYTSGHFDDTIMEKAHA